MACQSGYGDGILGVDGAVLGYSHHWECRCGTGEEEEVASVVSYVVGHDSWVVPSYLWNKQNKGIIDQT